MTPKPVRVRIAPSPTGFLHVGTARTALFNWLFAKNKNGRFVVRVEDTDKIRSEKKFEEDILSALAWLGLDFDEGPLPGGGYKGEYGPYRQSERTEIYKRYLNALLQEKKAYYCFCKKEELEAERTSMSAQGLSPKYGGKCRALLESEVNKNIKEGLECAIRFKAPEKNISFIDIIRGKIEFDMALGGDFVIAKNLETPLYNFAATVDDELMKISHVIRGEDHIANTPKQIVLQNALNFSEPQYAHLPLILDPARSKMSKRFSATALQTYRENGYLSEAIMNFLALLGWHPTNDKEIMDVSEFIKEFSLERVQKGGAIFNLEKLDWLNAQYIRKMSSTEILKKIKARGESVNGLTEQQELALVDLIKERLHRINDFFELTKFFYVLGEYPAERLIWKKTTKAITFSALQKAIETLSEVKPEDFSSKQNLELVLDSLIQKFGRGEVFWPLRVALSGLEASPGPYEIMIILGKDETLSRLKKAVQKLA